MSKLHLIKPRNNKASLDGDVTDLRGLVTDDVLKKSFPYGRMSVMGITEQQMPEVHSVIEQYECIVFSTEKNGEMIIQYVKQQDGLHKFHAVVLFTTALALNIHFPKAHFYIYEISGLHEQLKKSIFGKKLQKTPGSGKEISDEVWTQFNTRVTLAPAVRYHLNQAGYNIDKKNEILCLNDKEIHDVREHLMNTTTVEKKAA